METEFNNTGQKKFYFLFLIFFSFFLLSFNINSKENKQEKNNATAEKEISIVITKKTTKEELEKIKQQVVDEGLQFNYGNVNYNENNEIISISIYYKDANNNSGNYSVSSQNPINNIVIESDGTKISVKSEGSSNQAFINQGSGEKSSKAFDEAYEEQRKAMDERREQMEKEMEERMQEMKERHAQMEAAKPTKNNISQKSPEFNGNSYIITKNTTDSELLKIQNNFDSENISFNYKDLQRNDRGEVTHISLTIDNQNGSISTSGFGNGRDAIKDITVAVDKQTTIMKNAE